MLFTSLISASAGALVNPTGSVSATTEARAPAIEAGPRWGELSSAQRSLLMPIQQDWPHMDERSKQRWLGVAARLGNVGPAERDRIQARMTEWANLSPQQRTQMRMRYQEARQVAPKSRQDRWAAYQALTPEERERLAAKASHQAHGASSASGSDRMRPRAIAVTRKPVSPSVVQATPGATTTLISRKLTPPPHVQPGMPRIMASPELVDSRTLLPKRPTNFHPPSAPLGALAAHE